MKAKVFTTSTGESDTLTNWSKRLSIPRTTLESRVAKGWHTDRVLGFDKDPENKPNYLTAEGAEFREWHKRMGFPTVADGAKALSMPEGTYVNYFYGRRPVPKQIALLCDIMARTKGVQKVEATVE